MTVFKIDRFGASSQTASAIRDRVAMLVTRRSRRRASTKTLHAVEAALAAMIGAVLAIILVVGLGPLPEPPAAPQARPAAAPAITGPVNPFTSASAAPAPTQLDIGPNLAETTLNLTLHGTWLDENGGTAIIKTPDEKQGRFAVGAAIWDGVTLERVYRDQVVIARNGVHESLRLANRESVAIVEPQLAPEMAAPIDANASPGITQIGTVISVAPQVDEVGNMSLVLLPAGDEQAFAATGLRPGDILVSLDGRQIGTDVVTAVELIESQQGRASIQANVLRDGVVVPITIVMSGGE